MTSTLQPANRLLRFAQATKLCWGMLLVLVVGALLSPAGADGSNIFLSVPNLTDVLRQVAITGIAAVGMTLVILTAGIDLSVGSVMAFSCTLTAMLLTQHGWHNGGRVGIPATMLVGAGLTHLISARLLERSGVSHAVRMALTGVLAVSVAAILYRWLASELANGFGVFAVLLATLSVGLLTGALSGLIVAWGRLQPFIATLAMMVTVLGAARLTAGPDQSVYPVYTGSNATAAFEVLRSSLCGVPVPGLVFLSVLLLCWVLLSKFRLGREIYAVGGNEKAAHLAGIPVARVKLLVYALSGMLAALAGVLYAAEYRQGKPDAGTGLELDAIAAVVIGGASLMGGQGSVMGTLIGVLVFGFLTNIFQLNNVDSNSQLVLKGVIIVAAVLLQESRGRVLWRWRRFRGMDE